MASHAAMTIKSTPALIRTATIGKTEPGADDGAAAEAMLVGLGVGVRVAEAVAEGVSSDLYGSRDPEITNGAIVGNPSGAQAGT